MALGLGIAGDRLLHDLADAQLSLDEAVATWRRWATVGGVAAAVIAAGVLFATSRKLRENLDAVRRAVEVRADGDSHAAVPSGDVAEVADLADAVARLAERNAERLEGVMRINNEQEAVLAGMAEGVLAIDADRRVISLNRSAGKLLGVNPAEIMGARCTRLCETRSY
ncbi:MAG: PAS domain-containing protein [Pirellulales bacterium]